MWDLGRVLGTDMNYSTVNLDKESIGSGHRALTLILGIISRFSVLKTVQPYFLAHERLKSFQTQNKLKPNSLLGKGSK